MVRTLALAAAFCSVLVAAEHAPQIPLQFSGRIIATSHLVPEGQEYPPWRKVMDVWYDYPAKKAKLVVQEGYDAGKTFIRRYDQKQEYMIRGGEFAECRREYLAELMPIPQLPDQLEDTGVVEMNMGRPCRLYSFRDRWQRVKVLVDEELRIPLAVTDEGFHEGSWEPLMTFQFESLTLKAPEASEFELPPRYTPGRRKCERYVGGFPYIHMFHHYLMV